jgi:ferritin-like metal-binding protein YciE
MLTARAVAEWAGRTVQDPYGETLGQIVGAMFDRATGAPEWLIVAAGGSDGSGALVPVAGACPTGKRIRVVATAERVRSAPQAKHGEDLDVERKRRAAEHYGLKLDTAASPTGQLRRREAMQAPAVAEPAAPAPLARASPEQRRRVVEGLRAAHAIEQASLKLLAAMRWRLEDQALVHAVALHHKETNRHAERVRERLYELEETRMRPFDWAGKTLAYLKAQAGRRRTHPDPHDLRDAHAFEQREISAYEELERLALGAGDERTAKLCRDIRADELAMAIAIERSRLWAQPGPKQGKPSPFSAPEELAEIAPKS